MYVLSAQRQLMATLFAIKGAPNEDVFGDISWLFRVKSCSKSDDNALEKWHRRPYQYVVSGKDRSGSLISRQVLRPCSNSGVHFEHFSDLRLESRGRPRSRGRKSRFAAQPPLLEIGRGFWPKLRSQIRKYRDSARINAALKCPKVAPSSKNANRDSSR